MLVAKNIKQIRFLILIPILFLFSLDLHSQYDFFDYKTDSILKIENEIHKENNLKLKAENYITLLRYYLYFDIINLYDNIDSLRIIANQIESPEIKINTYYLEAEIEKYNGSMLLSAEKFNLGINIAKEIRNDSLIALGYLSIGKLYSDFSYLNQALKSLTKALSIYKKQNDFTGLVLTNLYMGRLKFFAEDIEAAMKHYDISQTLSLNKNILNWYATALIYKGEAFLKLNNMDSANTYINLATVVSKMNNLKYSNILANKFKLSYFYSVNLLDSAIDLGQNIISKIYEKEYFFFKGDIYTIIAHCFQAKGYLDSALSYNLLALETRKIVGFKLMVSSSYLNIGDAYLQLKDYKNAINYLDSSIAISLKSNKYSYVANSYLKLSQAYDGKKDISNAFLSLQKYVYYRDLFEKEKNSKDFSLLSTKLDFEKSKLEINKIKLQNQKNFTIYISLVATLSFVIAIIIFFFFLRKNKDNIVLKNQKNEINKTFELLKESQEELKYLNEGLENRVEERTVDLNAEINKRKMAEKQLIQSKDNITKSYQREKELNQLKTDLINMISHEYRTPLTVIASSADLLKYFDKTKEPDKFNRQLEKISLSISRMTSLLDNVLTYGKMKVIQDNSELNDIELNKYIKNLTDEQNEIYKNRFNIIFNSNSESIKIYTDEKMLWHIFSNIISNAFKYSDKSNDIIITLNELPSEISISIKDFGIGIAEDELPNISEPFFRAKNTEFIQGTGFGLSIVKNFVEILNGEMKIISQLNIGTEVVVVFNKENQIS